VDWDEIAPAFEPDGALRDIYVLETTLADWQAVLDALRGWTPRPAFVIGSADRPLPDRAEDIFASQWENTGLLSLFVGGMRLNCHFFTVDEIEFDLDPAEVAAPSQLAALTGFMRLLAGVTGKPVILTDENNQANPIFRVLPET
jgi:hypothetical protein